MDESGRMLSSVLMFSKSLKKVLTIIFLVDKFNILMDDGLVISGGFDIAVDIHCDDISCSECDGTAKLKLSIKRNGRYSNTSGTLA